MKNPKRFLERLHQKLLANNAPIYYQCPLPCELDDEIRELINLFIEADSAERNLILSSVGEEHSGWLFAFAERMAALGVRENSRERLLEGLLALIIEGFKFDYRDNITVWAPLYHSAVKIGIDPEGVFQEAASYAENTVSDWMLDFPKRSPEERSLRAFRFKEAYGPDGFRYERLPIS